MTPEEIKALQDKLAQLESEKTDLTTKLSAETERASSTEATLSSLRKEIEEGKHKKATEAGDTKTLLEIAEQKIQSLTASVQEFENEKQAKKEVYENTEKVRAFKEALGGDLANDGYLKLVDFSKVLGNPEIKDRFAVHADSLKLAVDTFKKNYPEAIKVANSSGQGVGAQGSNRVGATDDFTTRAKKLGLLK